MTGIELSASVV